MWLSNSETGVSILMIKRSLCLRFLLYDYIAAILLELTQLTLNTLVAALSIVEAIVAIFGSAISCKVVCCGRSQPVRFS